MTLKQTQILKAALKLFNEEGYHATSTSRIAKAAQVSEGLIFRHFKNKEGLVHVILEDSEKKIQELFLTVLNEEDIKLTIKKTIEIPFNIKEETLNAWRLQFKLDSEIKHPSIKKLQPLKAKLIKAFDELRYKNPELEARFLIQYLNGIFPLILKGELEDQHLMMSFLLNKYHLNE